VLDDFPIIDRMSWRGRRQGFGLVVLGFRHFLMAWQKPLNCFQRKPQMAQVPCQIAAPPTYSPLPISALKGPEKPSNARDADVFPVKVGKEQWAQM
jgi:hypothetical protein